MGEILEPMGRFPDVLTRLKREHQPKYAYRGQVQEWPGALVPSLFRNVVPPDSPFTYEGDQRLRGLGNAFVEELSPQAVAKQLPPDALHVYRQRIAVAQELRHAFGYPLCQMFSQQAGLCSEGLDVTRSVDVATFFATHEFIENEFVPASCGRGVIYRFSVEPPDTTLPSLNDWDFYSCPSYLDSFEVIQCFGHCSTVAESIQSLQEYRETLLDRISQDPHEARRNRPFHLIKFPADSRYYSRIVQQHAGLILPDMILTNLWSRLEVSAPPGSTSGRHQPCIEDLKTRPGTSVFTFTHDRSNADRVNVIRDIIFCKDDIICFLFRVWLSRVFGRMMFLFRDSVLVETDESLDLLS